MHFQAAPASNLKLQISIWEIGVEVGILVATALSFGGWILSALGCLTPSGYFTWFVFIIIGLWIWIRRRGYEWRGFPWHSFTKNLSNPFAGLYVFLFLAQAIGGGVYPPTNYDGLTYRLPRVLHYLNAHCWYWTGSWNDRMDFSALGYEWLMAPLLAFTHSDRLLFLPNLFSYAVLPSLVFTTFRGLGVGARISRYWMWLLPCAYSLVLQAGSIGNDAFALPFLLASLTFSARARSRRSHSDAYIAILAMALLTGVKASNIPLLLPCLIAFLPGLPQFLNPLSRRPELVRLALVSLLGMTVSFIPMAFINWRMTGDWSGDPRNSHLVKVKSPVFGIAGNTLQLLEENLEPPILPNAASINSGIEVGMQSSFLHRIRDEFPRLSLGVNDLAGEEAAGLGIGLTVLGFAFYSVMISNLSKIKSIWTNSSKKQTGLLVSLAAWVAIFTFMAKLGSESAPRIATPYYPLLFILPSLLPCCESFTRARCWLVCSWIAAASVMPAVILSPARPLFPVQQMVNWLESRVPGHVLALRMKTVYEVYSQRSDPQSAVRESLPAGARVIGFAGTADESEISFWHPFGGRAVRDLRPVGSKKLPQPSGVDAIVTSDWGCNDRFGRTPETLASAMGWTVSKPLIIRSRAGASARRWYILQPSDRE